jgi:hypothetical protein
VGESRQKRCIEDFLGERRWPKTCFTEGVYPIKLLLLGSSFIAATACGSQPDAPGSPAAGAPAAAEQPFSQIVKASPAAQSTLGVVEWWTTIFPGGQVAISGMDASHSARVDFVSTATQSKLWDPNGSFEMHLDGNKKVLSNTMAENKGARRTLELMSQDLARPAANTTTASTPASVPMGELHLTDDTGGCPHGTLVEDCPHLLPCDGSSEDRCKNDSANLALVKAMNSEDCHAPWYTWFWHGIDCDPGKESDYLSILGEDHCTQCSDKWHTTPERILNCPLSTVANTGVKRQPLTCDYALP